MRKTPFFPSQHQVSTRPAAAVQRRVHHRRPADGRRPAASTRRFPARVARLFSDRRDERPLGPGLHPHRRRPPRAKRGARSGGLLSSAARRGSRHPAATLNAAATASTTASDAAARGRRARGGPSRASPPAGRSGVDTPRGPSRRA